MIGPFRKRHYRTIPYGMFDNASFGLQAKNARILERIYHKGNAQGWDGKEVLQSLVETHGKPRVSAEEAQALSQVFAIIMWGELAAWRISAELADELEPLEAKMAATSQAFDEARHFYVMHDYLEMLGGVPKSLPWGARRLLEEVMNADHLTKKLLGMQLMVEPVALTLFQVVRQLELEPVLTHLLPYYERDESRHVALGLQYLPAMLSQMNQLQRLELWVFQMKLLNYELWSNMMLAKDLQVLGVDPQRLIDIGKSKQLKALELVLESLNIKNSLTYTIMDRYADCMSTLTLPSPVDEKISLLQRFQRAASVAIHGRAALDIDVINVITDEQTPLIQSLQGTKRTPPGARRKSSAG